MSRYQPELLKVRDKIEVSAKASIDHLYNILVNEDKRTPMEARKTIESDLGDKYKLSTIVDCLPPECKDKVKVAAGKVGAKITHTNEGGGQVTVTTESDRFNQAENTNSDKEKLNTDEPQGFIPEGVDDSNVKYWEPADERHPSVEILAMKNELDIVKNQMEELRKNTLAKDARITKLTNDVIVIEQAREKLERMAKPIEAQRSWTPEPSSWEIGGGPEPDGTDDFFETKISLGRVLEHLRLLKLTYGNGVVRVSARIIVTQKPAKS